MDRNVVIATVLIGLIMFVWLYFLSPPPPPPPPVEDQAIADTVDVAPLPDESLEQPDRPPQPLQPAIVDSTVAAAMQGEERFITVETDLYTARFSTKGATLVSFTLKEYKQFDQTTPIELIDTTAGGAIGLVFTTPASHNEDTRRFYFEPSTERDVVQVTEAGTTLSFVAGLGQGAIRQTYSFAPGTYEVGLSIEQENAGSFATTEGYDLVWNGAVPFSEAPNNRKGEVVSLGAYARSGGEVDGITLTGEEFEEMPFRGSVSWIAVKNKYFAAVVIPEEGVARKAELIGERFGDLDAGTLKEYYTASLSMPPATGEADTFRLYLGPLEFYRITAYKGLDIYDMVDYGWDAFEWVTRPLAKFVFIPAFTLLSKFIANYGLVIIIFALLIKLILFPLTRTSFRSMARMRELQPKMQEIKEKYADNPQKQQEATMKLYKTTGVNPLGGCLPMVLQYPIIIALWQFLQQSIEIRQQSFLWSTDLSAPDIILSLPFAIPLYGDFVAGFTLLMGLSLIVQMRVQATPTTGAQAKMFTYIMPVFIFVIFNNLPSGLSLYYLCYNVITAVQQKLINRSIEAEKEEAGAGGKGGKKGGSTSKAAKLPKNGRPKGGKAKKGSKQVRTR
ncbi:MAG: membrane protein insertase YidC [Rhodothermales bacterium]